MFRKQRFTWDEKDGLFRTLQFPDHVSVWSERLVRAWKLGSTAASLRPALHHYCGLLHCCNRLLGVRCKLERENVWSWQAFWMSNQEWYQKARQALATCHVGT